MFPIMTFLLLLLFAVLWLVLGCAYWEKKPVRVAGLLFAVMLVMLAFSLNTPDCQTWSCENPPETMTAPQHELNRLEKLRDQPDKDLAKEQAELERMKEELRRRESRAR